MYDFCYSDCDAGYIKNEQSGVCEDIDECESGDATCDMSTQVCYNTLGKMVWLVHSWEIVVQISVFFFTTGNYKCLDIIQSPSVCSDGFRYVAKTESCDG